MSLDAEQSLDFITQFNLLSFKNILIRSNSLMATRRKKGKHKESLTQ